MTCFMDGAEQLPTSLAREMLSFRVTGTIPGEGTILSPSHGSGSCNGFCLQDCEVLGVGDFILFTVSVPDKALGGTLPFTLSCPCDDDSV